MDSQQPSNNNNNNSNNSGSTSYESANTNISGSLSDSLQDHESLFLRYVSTLSPLKASSVAQGSLGLNFPPLVFNSPHISQRETQFVGRPQGTQSLGGEISQSGKGGNCLGEAHADSGKSKSQKPLPEMSITDDVNQMYAIFDANTQYNSSSLSIEQYLVDPGDIDQMYAAEKSLSDPIESKEDILKIDRKDGPGDKAEKSLPLSDDPTNLEQYRHDQLSKDIKGCEDHNQMVSTSHVTLENILQDDSVALKYHGNRRRCLQFEDGNSEELNQPLGASKKKKKVSATADGNGCKRCRCLKSKCLKLYCDCFALGIYCTDPCECQSCLNRPEYADTVRETRQQIESRDPLAFAPKILQSNTDNKENIKLTTPSSARHKRGCNCKKSTCLKKYCECYRANVGCSSGCRCEGCKNSYGKKEGGKKEDGVALEHDALSKERVSSIAQKELASTLRSKLQLVKNMRYDLSPTTPSLQCSDQGKEAAKSRVISGNYLPSPVSHIDTFLSYANYTRSSDYLRSSQSFLETNEMLGTAPRALLQLTPLSNPEPLSNGWTNVSQSQLSYGCIRQLPGGSLGWHSYPVTPGTRVGEAQHLQCPESDSRIFNIPENETPHLLQDASPLMRSVIVNSPTQKRVSPLESRHYDIGSSSSGILTNGRKFAFTSVPSFPPLSPFVDSKGSDNGNKNLGNRDSK